MQKKFGAFNMWLYRRILRIRFTNEAVLERMGKKKEVMNTVKIRKLEYLGHITRHRTSPSVTFKKHQRQNDPI
jgi:hypothetical protein